MRLERRVVIRHRFTGTRFSDHGLLASSLSELVQLSRLLIDTAKEIWRKKHGHRIRLPQGFEKQLEMKIYSIEPNCATVALEQLVEIDELSIPFPDQNNELDEAASLIIQAIECAHEKLAMPEDLPQKVLPSFAEYGKTLLDDEYFELATATENRFVKYNTNTKLILSEWQPTEHNDTAYLCGELRAVDLDRRKFRLHLSDGSRVDGEYSFEKEAMMTEALRQHETHRLKLHVRAVYDTETGKIKKIIEVLDYFLDIPDDERYNSTVTPIWDVISEIGSEIPLEAWEGTTADLAANLDEYMYGKH